MGYLRTTALLALTLAGCDAAASDFSKCQRLESTDPEAALAACETAIKRDANTESGKAAAAKVPLLQKAIAALEKQRAEEAARKAAEEKSARLAKAKAELDRLKSVPLGLNKKIRKQAMWDMGRGTVTPVINMITAEAGDPLRTYEAAFGAQLYYVWGADPGGEAPMEQIKNAPLAAGMPRGLSCGDYSESMVEFYSQGQRL